MKAAAFLVDFAPQGWETRSDMLQALGQALRRAGTVPIIAYPYSLPAEIEQRHRSAGIELATINYAAGRRRAFDQLGRIVRRHGIDLVHIRYFPYHTALPWMARALGVRRVVYTEAQSGEWTRQGWRGQMVTWRARLVTAPVDRLVAISEFVARRLGELGVNRDKIAVVCNGVDASRYVPDDDARIRTRRLLGVAEHELLVITVSALLPWKRTATLVESVARLVASGHPARLVVAGDGPLRGDLEALARRCGLEDRVHLAGYVADPRSFLQASDVFAHAAVGEAFGNAVIEAMACGLPVVASRSGALEEILVEGETGMLVRPDDPGEFARALGGLAAEPAMREKMGRAGRERVRERFTLERFARDMMEVYAALA
jgi:glycosyltransferase involved in cell wall biosynthesis